MYVSKYRRDTRTRHVEEWKEKWGTLLGVPGEQMSGRKGRRPTTHVGSSVQTHFVHVYTADFFSKTMCLFCDCFSPSKGADRISRPNALL